MADETLRCGDLEIRLTDGLVAVSGRPLVVSVREFKLLVALVEREGRIVSREELYTLAWDGTLRNGDRSVDVYVHKLRVKLESAVPDTQFIHTHFGFGYRLSPQPSHAFHKSTTSA